MPVVTVNPNRVPNQVNQTVMAQTTQQTYRQMCGQVQSWQPDAPATLIELWVNNAYRKILDKRLWYGLLVRGQIQVPNVYTQGTATFTLGSPVVTGINTAWTAAMVGAQIRSGFQTGFYNISEVNPTLQTITLDLPWGNATVAGAGYTIMQVWVSLGYNIKMILNAVNQRQGYPLRCNVPQAMLNAMDTWRTSTGWTTILANMAPSYNGMPMYELWPAPTYQQVFPFYGYVQTPDMVNDTDFPAAFVRCDLIVAHAISVALTFRKNSRYYDPAIAKEKLAEFNSGVNDMSMMDDNLYPKDLTYDENALGIGGGDTWWQMHDSPPY
jgi:hypothetical protein